MPQIKSKEGSHFKKVYPIFLDHEFNGVKLAVFKKENIYSFAEPPNPPKPIIAIMSSSVVSAAAEAKLILVWRWFLPTHDILVDFFRWGRWW